MISTKKTTNSLQAILDHQKQPAPLEAPAKNEFTAAESKHPATKSNRKNTVLIGGHFAPNVAKQLSILAAEEETTKQELLTEALNLLFVKKGKERIKDI